MKIFDSREKMIDFYISNDLIGAEIGVFDGVFSDYLIKKNPLMIYLVDLFEGVGVSGDANGNSLRTIDLSFAWVYLKNKYKDFINVRIFKGESKFFFEQIPNDHLHYVYIDADHSYEGALRDLEDSREKVQNNGYIMGHDYGINNKKTNFNWSFGVKKAVDEFCLKYNLSIESMANDGCTSFCIKNQK